MTRCCYLLSFRPPRVPKWWPHDGRKKFTMYGVLGGGDGWVYGAGSLMTLKEIEQAKATILILWPGSKFVVRKMEVSR